MDVGISGCRMDFQGWNPDLYHVQWEIRFHLPQWSKNQ